MPGQYPYALRYKYPHLKPQDVAIWARFIQAKPGYYESVDYDLAVGDKPRFDTTVEPQTGGTNEFNYRRKIDVVGYRAGVVEVVEIKPSASPSTIGQILGYKMLYLNYIDPAAKVEAVIITDRVMPDMAHLSYLSGVTLLVA